jgi:hypothetical protein
VTDERPRGRAMSACAGSLTDKKIVDNKRWRLAGIPIGNMRKKALRMLKNNTGMPFRR